METVELNKINKQFVFITKHGEIIDGKIESQANDIVSIRDRHDQVHEYRIDWIDYAPKNRLNEVVGSYFQWSNRKAKKLIIIGAGASHDFSSNKSIKYTPPLSNSLFIDDHFNILERFYTRVQTARGDLAGQMNLEQRLHNIFRRAKERYSLDSSYLLSELQFYLAHVFLLYSEKNRRETLSNYNTLVSYIREYVEDNPNEEVVIINFNYDTILDDAIEKAFRFTYFNINDYMGSDINPIKMFKVHGSCNWIRKLESTIELDEFVYNRNSRHNLSDWPGIYEQKELHPGIVQNLLEAEIEVISPNKIDIQENFIHLDKKPFLPHLLIPFNQKDNFLLPLTHVQDLRNILIGINEIITIGWKGEEQALQSLVSQVNMPLKKITIVDKHYDSNLDVSKFPFQHEILKKYGVNVSYFNNGFSGYSRGISNSEHSLFDSFTD
jgi:hypothetical protein